MIVAAADEPGGLAGLAVDVMTVRRPHMRL